MVERRAETGVAEALIARDHFCLACGGYIGSHGLPADFPRDLLWARLWCPSCNKWRRVDAASGRERLRSRVADVLESS